MNGGPSDGIDVNQMRLNRAASERSFLRLLQPGSPSLLTHPPAVSQINSCPSSDTEARAPALNGDQLIPLTQSVWPPSPPSVAISAPVLVFQSFTVSSPEADARIDALSGQKASAVTGCECPESVCAMGRDGGRVGKGGCYQMNE